MLIKNSILLEPLLLSAQLDHQRLLKISEMQRTRTTWESRSPHSLYFSVLKHFFLMASSAESLERHCHLTQVSRYAARNGRHSLMNIAIRHHSDGTGSTISKTLNRLWFSNLASNWLFRDYFFN